MATSPAVEVVLSQVSRGQLPDRCRELCVCVASNYFSILNFIRWFIFEHFVLVYCSIDREPVDGRGTDEL